MMEDATRPVRYVSDDEDSTRWDDFAFRDGDIVVSTRSKHGTTWVQTILLQLLHGSPLPDRLATLSPWLDARFEPLPDVLDRLAAQRHRRVIKTHTPLDGLPLAAPTGDGGGSDGQLPGRARVSWVVVARDPLDAAVSMWHQGHNPDRDRMRLLLARDAGRDVEAPASPPSGTTRAAPDAWLRDWVVRESDPVKNLDSLDGVLHHYADAWRRQDEPGVVLVHFEDLLVDLPGQVQRLAVATQVDADDDRIEAVAAASTFSSMQARADQLAPDPNRLLVDRAAFFRRGTSGTGRDLLSASELAAYHRRVRVQVPDDVADWLLADQP